jgi:hypothetical protein
MNAQPHFELRLQQLSGRSGKLQGQRVLHEGKP